MRDKTPAEVIRFLGLHQFLATQHQEMLERDVARYVQTEQLLDEILANGWITPFQHRLICDGQEERLLVGPYRILEQIGEGGMGVVYKAVYPKLNRLVALKIIQPHLLSQRPELIHRFEREARAAAQLMHPNVVVLYDAGNAGNIYFLAMEYVEGVTLDRLVRMQGPLPIKQATDYIRQAALGLQHAYDQGLVHRDIKPGNLLVAQRAPNSGGSSGRRSSSLIRRPILITQRDKKLALDSSNNPANHRGINSWGVVKILDMGLARIRDSFDDYSTDQPLTPLTRVGTLLGTPDFIAPEQARDPRGVDIRADLYSLGCSFYFLLSGRPPFSGGNDVQKIIRHQNERPVAIEELRPHLPEVITQVINRLLQKNPDDRYEVPQDLADELQAFLLRPPTTGAIAQESKVTASDVMLPAEVAQSFNPLPAMQPLNPTQRVATPQPPTLFGKPEMDPVTVHSLGSESSVSPESGRVEVPQNGRTASPQALRRLGIFNAHMGAVTGVSVTADGRMAASCGVDGRFRIWDLTAVPEPRETAASARPGCELETIAFHPDAAGVVIGGLQQGNAFVWFWDSREDAFFDWGAFSTSLSRGVGATAFAGDGKMFAAAIGSFVITWKTNGRVATSRTVVKGHTSPVRALAFSPDRKLLASGGDGKNARIWTFGWLGTSMKIKLKGHGEPISAIDFSPNGQFFASGSQDRQVMIWDLSNPSERPAMTLSGHTGNIRFLRFTADNSQVVTVSEGGQLVLWNLASGARVKELHFESGMIATSVAMSPDFRKVAIGSFDGRVALYELFLGLL